jgi:hypothetical protein
MGWGLFAARDLKKDEVIVAFTYKGDIIDNQEWETRQANGKGNYGIRLNIDKVYDCYDQARLQKCRASMANDARGTEYIQQKLREKTPLNNAKCTRGVDKVLRDGTQVPYLILRVRENLVIKKDTEIFWNYEKNFWT